MRRTLAILVIAASGFAIGVGADRFANPHEAPAADPFCPTEDSCRADYTGGAWVITPDVP